VRAAALLCLLLSLSLGACGSGGGAAPACRRVSTIDDGRPGACRSLHRNDCGTREYAITCGPGSGPPPDGAIVVVYDDPPVGCSLLEFGFGVPTSYCCPCQP
jgi:hypothetical protein